MKINYRPEIDGLRAIAILSVIVYHANLYFFGYTLLKGGFLGVDIFFVISGYLITRIIILEIKITNKFSYMHFYERRVRRIIPALFFIIIFSIPFAYIILMDGSLRDFSRSIISSVFFYSNFYFWLTSNIYAQDATLLKPLLNTWSLSVEEQFYIIYPFLLVLFLKFFRPYYIRILLLLFIISLIFATWSAYTDVIIRYNLYKALTLNFFDLSNFYLLTTRSFELLTGSLLCCFELNKKKNTIKFNNNSNQLFSLIGFFLLFYSLFFFNDQMPLPSFWTLVPLLGTFLIIWFSTKEDLVTKVLSSKIFVFTGLISYSLYLWHYPIFAFFRQLQLFNESILIKVIAIIMVLIFSVFSYYYIEKPFRNKKVISNKKLIFYIFSCLIIFLCFCTYITINNGARNWFPKIVDNAKFRSQNVQYNVGQGLKKVVLIGDSHATSLAFNLNEQIKGSKFSLSFMFSDLYVNNVNLKNRKTGIIDMSHLGRTREINDFLKKHEKLIVVLHHRWSLKILGTHFDNEEGFRDYQKIENKDIETYFEPIKNKILLEKNKQDFLEKSLILTINNILKLGHDLVLVYPVPETGFDTPKLMLRNLLSNYIFNKKVDAPLLTTSHAVYKKRNKKIFDILNGIQGTNVYRVYPDKSFCNTVVINRCVSNNTDSLFYSDGDHLSLEGSKYVVDDIVKIIKNIH